MSPPVSSRSCRSESFTEISPLLVPAASHGDVTSPPAPGNQGFCAWIAAFINYLTGKLGERLAPSELNAILNSLFSDWAQGDSFSYGGIDHAAWRSKQTGGVTYVVSVTAHDLVDIEENDPRAHSAGGRSVARALAEIKAAFPDGQVKVLIPVAQANSFFFMTRGHFVLLKADINGGKIQSAQIHDSKEGLIDSFYNGARKITQQLRDADPELDENFSVTVEHHGHQSLFNDSDCGRYAACYADLIADGTDLSTISTKSVRDLIKKESHKEKSPRS